MLYLNWRFTLISLSVAPVLFLVVYVFTRRIKKASRDVRSKESELVSMVEEVFSSIRVVKAFAREDYEERRFERQSLENVEAALQARSIKMKLSPVVDIIVATGTCLMLWYGARLVIAGQLTAGALVVFLLYLGEDVQADARPVEDDGHGLEGGRRLRADPRGARDRKRRARPAARAPGRRVQGRDRIRPRVVRLRSGSADSRGCQLRDRARAGRGIRRPDRRRQDHHHQPGRALLRSACPARSPSTARTSGGSRSESLRDQISFVLQDTLLFHAPIWQNIAYGRPEANRAEIIRAAELANAARVHHGDAGGLRHDGRRARGDACQAASASASPSRARSIRNTPILVLDEPTSGLDAQSEQAVFEALDRLMKGKTSIVIAHHLATILRADVIFVVKDTQLAERGTHDELLAAGGFYAELHDIQFGEPAPALA